LEIDVNESNGDVISELQCLQRSNLFSGMSENSSKLETTDVERKRMPINGMVTDFRFAARLTDAFTHVYNCAVNECQVTLRMANRAATSGTMLWAKSII
jgi:hypothetical protein